MLKINKIIPNEYQSCYDLISIKNGDQQHFKCLGWTINQFKNQLLKDFNLSFGLYIDNLLKGFVIGDFINFEKKIEYEIFLIYVSIKERELGYANKLLDEIPLFFEKNKLNKIFLEVSAINHKAIGLYKKNKFKKIGIRKNYYLIKNKKISAYFYEKMINE